jgi:hypothetical protein
MTTVNTEGFVTVWFSPKQTFRNVSKVCWDQNITDLGGGKWTIVNFLTAAEYAGKADLGYTSPDFPKSGGASSPQGAAANGVKVFRGFMNSYTNGQFRGGVRGITVSDKAARYQHCVVDNRNGTLTMMIAQPNGGTATPKEISVFSLATTATIRTSTSTRTGQRKTPPACIRGTGTISRSTPSAKKIRNYPCFQTVQLTPVGRAFAEACGRARVSMLRR